MASSSHTNPTANSTPSSTLSYFSFNSKKHPREEDADDQEEILALSPLFKKRIKLLYDFEAAVGTNMVVDITPTENSMENHQIDDHGIARCIVDVACQDMASWLPQSGGAPIASSTEPVLENLSASYLKDVENLVAANSYVVGSGARDTPSEASTMNTSSLAGLYSFKAIFPIKFGVNKKSSDGAKLALTTIIGVFFGFIVGYMEGDVIGCYISLPYGDLYSPKVPDMGSPNPEAFVVNVDDTFMVLSQLLRKAKQKNLVIPSVKKQGSGDNTFEGAIGILPEILEELLAARKRAKPYWKMKM
ncbi:hypothetical protein IFM89_038278 [Coptis chinensis]|uniref:Uncharacterized protein n=1 Tax=Coptis chinensis TaxID=261450 RepID=A0A835IHA0_9MAGN|nr:hypothetical protein IFM89_038278 [Coptis chinensis]